MDSCVSCNEYVMAIIWQPSSCRTVSAICKVLGIMTETVTGMTGNEWKREME